MATVIDTLVTLIDFKSNTAGLKQAEAGVRSIEVETKALNVALLNLQHLFSGIVSIFAIEKLVELNNEFDLVTNRLKSVGLAGAQLNDVFSKLLNISNKTGTSIEANSELYQQMSVSLGDAASEADKMTVVDTLNKLFAINGTQTRTAKAAMQDLTKAISGATVNYQELRYAMKDVPALQALIVNHFRSMGVDWKEAVEGNKLATADFIKILKDSNADLTKQFGLMSRTIPMAFMAITNSLSFFIGEIGKASSSVSIFTTLMDKLAAIFEEWGEAVKNHTQEAKAAFETFALFLGIISSVIAVRVAKMLLPFTRVAAGITILVLVIQDLWVFLRKGDSAFGNFLKWLGLSNEQIDNVRNSILSFISVIKSLVKWLLTSKAVLIGLSIILARMGILWGVEKIIAFVKALRALATTFAIVELAASPILLIIDAIIIAIVALVFVAYKFRTQILSAFDGIANYIGEELSGLYNFSKGIFDSISNFFIASWNKSVSSLKNSVNFIGDIFSGVKNTIIGVWDSIINSLIGAWDGFIDKIVSGFKFVKNTVNKALNLVGLGSSEDEPQSKPMKKIQGNVIDLSQFSNKGSVQSFIKGAQTANDQITGGFQGNIIPQSRLGQFNQSNQNTVNVTVNATTNADPEQIAAMTSKKVQDSLGQQFRSAAINADNSIAR